jgi:hypothetical protein
MSLKADARRQWVKCERCKREYQCTPSDDYYDNTSLDDGVCEACLLLGIGLTKSDVIEVQG